MKDLELTDKDKMQIKQAKRALKKLLEQRVEQIVDQARRRNPGKERDYLIDFANELEDYFLNEIEKVTKEKPKKNKLKDV